MRQLGQSPPPRPPCSILPPMAQKGEWSHAYLVREVRGEGLGREPLEEASGARSHCSSWSISSSSVRPPAGGARKWGQGTRQGWQGKGKGKVEGLRSGEKMQRSRDRGQKLRGVKK